MRSSRIAVLVVLTTLIVACGGGVDSDQPAPAPTVGDDGGQLPPPPPEDAERVQPRPDTPQLKLLAGSTGGRGTADGSPAVARFDRPAGIAVDAQGNAFVADLAAHTIRRIAADGRTSTLAGTPGLPGDADGQGATARFKAPTAVVLDGAGGVFVADTGNHTIRRVTAEGVVSTVAGTAGQAGAGVAGQPAGTTSGPALLSRFNSPSALARDGDRLFIADTLNHQIRVLQAGQVKTHAGTGTAGAAVVTETNPLMARFNRPAGLALRASDKLLFVLDAGNCVLRGINSAGTVGLMAGHNGDCQTRDDANPFNARLNTKIVNPDLTPAMAIAGDGRVYFSEPGIVQARLRFFADNGVVSPVTMGSSQLDGPFATASLQAVRGLAARPGTAQVMVSDDALIRLIDPVADRVSTLTGQRPALSGQVDSPDGSSARFEVPVGIAVAADGQALLVADASLPDTLRRVDASGAVSTRPLQKVSFSISSLTAAAETAAGFVYALVNLQAVPAVLQTWNSDGSSSFALGGTGKAIPVDGPVGMATMGCPVGMALDAESRAVVADPCVHAVRRITPQGAVSLLAGKYTEAGSAPGGSLTQARFEKPIDVAIGADGSVFVLDSGVGTGSNTLSKISAAVGEDVVTRIVSDLIDPRGLAIDEAGNLYVAEGTVDVIKRIRPNGEVSVIAGQLRQRGFAPGPLPGVLAFPAKRDFSAVDGFAARVGMRVRNNRLVLSMERGVVEIGPLPQ